MGPAEITAGIQSLRLAFDMAKGLKDISDAAERNGKILELQGIIMEAQAGAIEAQQAHAANVQRVGALEAEIARLKTWEGEKQKYELKDIGTGPLAYMLKPDMRGSEPPHWLCTNCYEGGKRSIVQYSAQTQVGRRDIYKCPACALTFQTYEHPKWL